MTLAPDVLDIVLIGRLGFSNPEALFAAAGHRRDDARFQFARTIGIDARGVAMAGEGGGDHPLVRCAAFGSVRDACQLQAERPHILTFGTLRKVRRPRLDFLRDSLPIRQHPPVVRLERDVLPLNILPGRGRTRDAARVGHHFYHCRLIPGRKLPSTAERSALPCPVGAHASTGSAAAETAVDWIGRCTARGCGAAAAAATSARGGQRPRSLLVEFARNGRASNDLLGWRRLRKRWKPYPTAKQIILDSTARPWTSSIRACLSNRTARRLDLLEPPGDLRGAVHEAASSVNSGGKMSFASRRSFEP